MQVDRLSPVPMWHQIELALMQDIVGGALPEGTRLPNESDLAARFGVNRHTARRALARLADKGVVRVRRGLGTFVEMAPLTYAISDRTRFTETLQRQSRAASRQLLSSHNELASAEVAEALRIDMGNTVTVLHTLSMADGVPVSTGSTSIPAARFPGVAGLYQSLMSMTAVWAAFGLGDYRRASTQLTAGLPTEEEAALLRQSPRDPVLVVHSVDVDMEGTPISFAAVRFAGARVRFLMETAEGAPA